MKQIYEHLAIAQGSSITGFGILLFAWICLAVYCFFHCASNKRISNASRGIWLLVIFLIPFLGAVGYLIGGREETEVN